MLDGIVNDIQQHLFMVSHDALHIVPGSFAQNSKPAKDPGAFVATIDIISGQNQEGVRRGHTIQPLQQPLKQPVRTMHIAHGKEWHVWSDRRFWPDTRFGSWFSRSENHKDDVRNLVAMTKHYAREGKHPEGGGDRLAFWTCGSPAHSASAP